MPTRSRETTRTRSSLPDVSEIHFVRQGEVLPPVESTLTDGGEPVSGITAVRFRLKAADASVYKIDQPATVVDASAGRVRYSWQAGDTTFAGAGGDVVCFGEWVATIGASSRTLPEWGPLVVVATAGLLSLPPTPPTADLVRLIPRIEGDLGRSLEASELLAAIEDLRDLQEQVEAYLQRAITRRTTTETGLAWNGEFHVKKGPISSVSAVSIDGVALATGAWTVGRDHVTVPAFDGQAVSITYVGGWDADGAARPAWRLILDRIGSGLAAVDAGGVVQSEEVALDEFRHKVTYAASAAAAGGFSASDLGGLWVLKRRTAV